MPDRSQPQSSPPTTSAPQISTPQISYANSHDRALQGVFEQREADWRKGAIVYQVLVDRFAPSANLDAKRHLYPAPKQLRDWDEVPTTGSYLAQERVWSHEIDFWGGDLESVRSRLDYLQQLGVDVVYLCPIHLAWTNHGYDALDYAAVRPEFGSRDDVAALAADLHQRGMKLVLDGVFNHVGRNSELFRAAEADPDSPYRDWFDFSDEYDGGVRAWFLAENLPELVMENPEVQAHVYADDDSVVRSFLRDGVDGWRLDVAFDLGMRYLGELTEAAHREKPGSLVLGEITTFPAEWFPELDAVLHFVVRKVLIMIVRGEVSAAHGTAMLQRIYDDADFEHLLMSWIYLDNHDMPRLTHEVPDPAARDLATVLQFTLPGAVNLYYGSELGMSGGDDPANRAPMRWDLVGDDNPTLARVRQLIAFRREHRALRVGNLRWLVTERLIGFERHTDRVADAVIVLANPGDEQIHERVLLPDSKLMDACDLVDAFTGERVEMLRSVIAVRLDHGQTMVLTPIVDPPGGYTQYKRVQ